MDEELFRRLRADYLGRLPKKIAVLEAALTKPSTEEIQRLAHTLRGSGGSYGFPQITEAAAAVEDAAPGDVPELTQRLLEVLRTLVQANPPD